MFKVKLEKNVNLTKVQKYYFYFLYKDFNVNFFIQN